MLCHKAQKLKIMRSNAVLMNVFGCFCIITTLSIVILCNIYENESIANGTQELETSSFLGKKRQRRQTALNPNIYDFSLSFFLCDDDSNCFNLFLVDEYLIDGENCKIPHLSPFNEDALKCFHPEKYKKCSDKSPITFIEYHSEGAKLMISSTHENSLTWWQNNMSVSSSIY
jgi:hypothetical protein